MTPTKAATKKAVAKKAAPTSDGNGNRTVSDAQKSAMAEGRVQGAAVRRYLEALRAEQAPKRKGRRRTPEQIRERIVVIDNTIGADVDPLTELEMRQERLKLLSELEDSEPKTNSAQFEADFVKAIKPYAQRKGISYAVLREFGVPAEVLRTAEVPRR